MDGREVLGWDWTIAFAILQMLTGWEIPQNAPYFEIFAVIPGVGIEGVFDEPAAQAAAAAPAGGGPVSSQLSITTQQALDSGIVLALRQRAPDDEEEELDYCNTFDEEEELDYCNTFDEEDEHMSNTTLLQDQVVQPRAIDVSPETPSITPLESPENVHVDALNSPSNITMEADDASSRLQQEVGSASGTGPHIANPALDIILATPVAAATSNVSEVISTSRLGTSLDLVQVQESSTTSNTRQKKQVTSSESSSSFTASSSSI